MSKDTEKLDDDQTPPTVEPGIAADWADEYDEGAELFGASFDADDFDTEYGVEHPDGTTIAVRRCQSMLCSGSAVG